VTPETGILPLVVGFTLVSIGSGPLATLSTNLVLGSVPPERAGSAASLTETGGQFGYAIGIAVLGSAVTLVYRAQLLNLPPTIPTAAATSARAGLAAAREAAASLRGSSQRALIDIAEGAFTNGISAVAIASAIVLAIVAVVAVGAFRGERS
jgi:DHA2 family multidrug resistance protein-like MFS transporter